MNKLSTLQSRLGQKQDRLRRLLLDNQIRLIGFISDVIRMKVRKTYEGDTTSYIIESCDVIQVSFPPLEDIPYRKIKVDEKTHIWQLTSLIGAFEDDMQQKAYTVQIPYNFNVNVNDLLFRIMVDEDQKFPIIIPLQIQENLGTFGAIKLIMTKYKATIPTDNFPQEVVDTIQQMAERRLKIHY
jgi:hypothetical protein